MAEAKDTNGNILVPGKLYLVKMNEHWDKNAYGPPYTPEKLIFQAYDNGEPRFMKNDGESAGGKPSSTYVYEPVVTRRPATNPYRRDPRPRYHPNLLKHASSKRVSSKGGFRKNKKQTRRRKMRR